MDPNDTSVIFPTTYQLLRQSVVQKPQVLYAGPGNQFNMVGVATQFKKFERKDLKPGTSIEVAVAYPTDKKQKIAPLRMTIESYIKQQAKNLGVPINITEFFFKVKDTGVGEQPLHPGGYFGALNRIYYILDALLEEREWEQSFTQPAIKDFQRIIIPSLESDILCQDEVIYDKANVIFYECITRQLVAGMGTGPGVQKDIFQLSQRLGVALFNNPQAVTYGKVLQTLFPELQINHADWHGVVCHRHPDGKKRDRAYFIKELCEALNEQLKGFFEKVFDPENKTS